MARLSFIILILALVFACVVKAHGGHDHDHDHHGHDHDHDHEHEIDESAVVVLGEDNFDDIISKNEFVFVEFYAPWCGHCKHLAPEYASAALTLKNEGSSVVIGKVDATVHASLGQKFGVRGYPTLKFFRNGSPMDYEGGRSAKDIVAFIKKKTGPTSAPLASAEEIEKFKDQSGTKVIAYITSDQLSVWFDVGKSSQVEDFQLGHVIDSTLFGSHHAPAIAIHQEGVDPITYSGEFEKAAIASWANTEGYPLVNDLAQPVWQRCHDTKKNLVALVFKEVTAEDTAMALALGVKFKGQVVISTTANIQIAERWGASGKKLPTAIFVKWTADNPKFIVFDEDKEEFNAATAENFIAKTISGEYQSFRRSEPIPEKNDGPVKILVGKNFEEIVYDKEKDVFVEFYAPWCGHCKKLSPLWDELGNSLKNSPSVVIAKMDATANTPPSEIDVRGYPTLILFPADKKTGVPYEGDRDLPSMKKFVMDHASTSLNKEEL